jgi:hypothetical protein
VIRGDDYAEVTVSYSRFGKVWEAGTYDYDKKCNQGRFTETGLNNRGSSKKIDNDTGMPLSDYCSYLQITNDTFYVTYSLEKPGKFWRILDGYKERCLSLSSAVKVMECWATQERKEDPLPSKNQTVQINKVINMLKVINTFKEEAARWDN